MASLLLGQFRWRDRRRRRYRDLHESRRGAIGSRRGRRRWGRGKRIWGCSFLSRGYGLRRSLAVAIETCRMEGFTFKYNSITSDITGSLL